MAIKQINKTATTLKKGSKTIPSEKLSEIKQSVVTLITDNWHAISQLIPPDLIPDPHNIEMTEPLISFCVKMPELKLTNQDRKNPHGIQIVEIMKKEDRLSDFIKLWRTNFLQSMEPQFLPMGWRIEHTVERSFGVHSKFNKQAAKE